MRVPREDRSVQLQLDPGAPREEGTMAKGKLSRRLHSKCTKYPLHSRFIFLRQIILRQLLFYVSQQGNLAVSSSSDLADPLESDRVFLFLFFSLFKKERTSRAKYSLIATL